MIERDRGGRFFAHLLLIVGVLIVAFPIYYTFIASTQTIQTILRPPLPLTPGGEFAENYGQALFGGVGRIGGVDVGTLLFNTSVMALGIALGKIAISLLSAFAIVFFRFPFRMFFFWMIFVTLMLPVEVRILPTYEAVANAALPLQWLIDALDVGSWLGALTGQRVEISLDWNMMDSYGGLILPLIASATATFLFRQFFLTVPEELCEAARIDGASPLRFFWSVLLPLSRANMVALSIILFLYGWNQYLWPLLFTTDKSMATAVIGLKNLIPQSDSEPAWNIAMNAALLVMLPPVVVVMALQRWLVKGLVDSGK